MRGLPDALLTWNEAILGYRFGDGHPFDQRRLVPTLDLMRSCGLIDAVVCRESPVAARTEIELTHQPDYVALVQKASDPAFVAALDASGRRLLAEHGLGTEDDPTFAGMHEAAAAVVGASVSGAEALARGRAQHVFNPGGGLHHARAGRAAGFCIYNDVVAAIGRLRQAHGLRVAYVDMDAHHGDGVQWAFYDDPGFLFISLHETGRYLFPGSGAIEERGEGGAYGNIWNVPLDAFTEDDSWLEVLRAVAFPVVKAFRPDVLVTQHGCDGHRLDPLTHLALTTRSFQEGATLMHRLAHEAAGGRWLALGGGGYDGWRVVPRAWTMVWAEMRHATLPEAMPADWLRHWQPISPVPLPETWLDNETEFPPMPRRSEIEAQNARTVRRLLQHLA